MLENIDWRMVGQVLATAAPLAVAALGASRGPGALRSRLRHDVDMLDKLPEGTAARASMLGYLDEQISRIRKLDAEATRDVTASVLGAVLALVFIWGAIWLIDREDWWWQIMAAGPAVLALAALIYLFEAVQRVPRDDKGHPI
ncbi:hypothetical protein [Nocardioides antri]|uniref:Uncharacterized protein n=1 Tax=Nocardioides antri TaxID=2607659 RepID=A0A5B1M1D3_9ACTN|nr:hypothetical protein [Nocardioides antri]KAA1426466.1 hypothetical protein F0U47_13775 [Nocardioides antri]